MSNTDYIQIKDLKVGMNKINAVFIVLEVGPPVLTQEAREVRSLRVADATAAVNLSVWDEAGALLQPGDIVRLTRGYTSLWRNALTLYTGKSGDIQKIDEFCMLFNEQVFMSEPQPAGAVAAATAAAAAAAAPTPGGASPHKPERFVAERGEHGAGAKQHAHKTYVRGRGQPRGGYARR